MVLQLNRVQPTRNLQQKNISRLKCTYRITRMFCQHQIMIVSQKPISVCHYDPYQNAKFRRKAYADLANGFSPSKDTVHPLQILLTLMTGAPSKQVENSCMLIVADMRTSFNVFRFSIRPFRIPSKKSPWICRSCTSSTITTSYWERSESVESCRRRRPSVRNTIRVASVRLRSNRTYVYT